MLGKHSTTQLRPQILIAVSVDLLEVFLLTTSFVDRVQNLG